MGVVRALIGLEDGGLLWGPSKLWSSCVRYIIDTAYLLKVLYRGAWRGGLMVVEEW